MNKIFLTLAGSILLICLYAGCANAPTSAENITPNVDATTAAPSAFPELKAGMTAEVVRTKLGEPFEIRPMESEVGKAEVWVFRIERTINTTQVATGTRDVPAFMLATADKTTTVPEMVYSMADKKAETILSLLMLNGRLIAQTSATRERLEYK